MKFDVNLLEEILISINSFYNFTQIRKPQEQFFFSVAVASISSLLKRVLLFKNKSEKLIDILLFYWQNW